MSTEPRPSSQSTSFLPIQVLEDAKGRARAAGQKEVTPAVLHNDLLLYDVYKTIERIRARLIQGQSPDKEADKKRLEKLAVGYFETLTAQYHDTHHYW
jgi:hypothetical protein